MELNHSIKKIDLSSKIINLFFILASFVCILPIIIIISSSLSTENDIIKYGYPIIPRNITDVAYKVIFMNPKQIIDAYAVTISVTLIGTIIGLWLVTSLSFVIVRKDFMYRKQLSFLVFFTMLFNGGLVPNYILISQWLHMKDTIFALFVPYLVSAWYVLLMKSFLQNIPESLFESAKLDGAGELRIFVNIIIPLSKPAIATIGIFMVLQYWNDWWLCLLYINESKLYNLQYLLMRIVNQIDFMTQFFARMPFLTTNMDLPNTSARFAMCLLAAGPMLFVFMFFQKYFVKGLTVGSIKG